MLQVTGVQDLKFAEDKLVSSRNFANKIYNASRFVLMNLGDDYEPGPPTAATVADAWILSRLAGLAAAVDEGLTTFEFGEVARRLYDFFWGEFADWYIELAKGRLNVGARDEATESEREARLVVQRNLVFVLDTALRLLQPMMPFITEEIWAQLPIDESDRAPMLLVAAWPDPATLASFTDADAEASMSVIQEFVSSVRAIRSRYSVPPRREIAVDVRAGGAVAELLENQMSLVRSLAGISILQISADMPKPEHSATGVAAGMDVYVPLEGLVDLAAERARVAKELERAESEHARLPKKLSNEGFLAKASAEVIEKDRAKASDLADEVGKLTAQLGELAG
jgi:valyl-tRNA synthetase